MLVNLKIHWQNLRSYKENESSPNLMPSLNKQKITANTALLADLNTLWKYFYILFKLLIAPTVQA